MKANLININFSGKSNCKYDELFIMTGVVLSDNMTVKVNNTNQYSIYYLSMVEERFTAGQILRGNLEIRENIKAGSTVLAPNGNKEIVRKLANSKVFFESSNQSFDLRNVISLEKQSVVFIPFSKS